jgi:hypothetical protein
MSFWNKLDGSGILQVDKKMALFGWNLGCDTRKIQRYRE